MAGAEEKKANPRWWADSAETSLKNTIANITATADDLVAKKSLEAAKCALEIGTLAATLLGLIKTIGSD